jgi:hypothetical protein
MELNVMYELLVKKYLRTCPVSGYLYCVHMGGGIYKLGFTRHNPKFRAGQLFWEKSGQLPLLEPELMWQKPVEDGFFAEHLAHLELAAFGVPGHYEYYRDISPIKLINTLEWAIMGAALERTGEPQSMAMTMEYQLKKVI